VEQHIKVVAVLNIVWGIMGAVAGLMALLLFGATLGIIESGTAVAMPLIALVGAAIVIFLLLLSVPSIVAGAGLLKFKPWSRTLAIIVSAFHLLSIPLGTALGIYGLWVLFSPKTIPYFASSETQMPRPVG
jgi:uncharacterized membrane protein YeaQ/YmgE (transglycosylase-associated protein family)